MALSSEPLNLGSTCIASFGCTPCRVFKHTKAPFPKPRIRESPQAQDELISFHYIVFFPGYTVFFVAFLSSSSSIPDLGLVI